MRNPHVSELIGRLIQSGVTTLKDTLTGCRVAGFSPQECAPVSYGQFPTTSANEMANTIVRVWTCLYSANTLTQALQACVNPSTKAPAFDAGTISAAVAQAVSLAWSATGVTQDFCHELGLYQGDVAHMKANAENVDYLAISCLPGDYTPSAGSVLAALQAIGVNVATLAQNKAADYRTTHHCWISQPIANQAFARLVVFESTGAAATGAIPGVFAGIQQFQPTVPAVPAAGIVVATTLLSTGSAGANPNAVLSALVGGAVSTINGGYNLLGVRVVVFTPAWMAGLATQFAQLKQQYSLQ
ncbi:hypothetical protein C2I33_15125 [Ralstonia solanacearum]|uniref:hypothetical protein n=1 Tax=Ralstonia solanacearum TaxID=305 RepID=UPI000181673F|nr:hypothetical protein [Ralstonia solanacearum]MDC6176479.1 hypothetical protein [Ralstonia solanacearum]MDC6209651.1 hypothetical protein [Ralstonia solanacearum]MDC6237921.1 hypothetical protein [Ralstonia solanacearum]MDD7799425.1 hypothetical protein [Ralstonia solanacearum]TYZ54165.1 hypothetical protein C2I33_15125 [Ralstonia solanacearum]